MIWRRLKKKPDPEKEEELRRAMNEEKLTLKDKFAMVLSAFLVIFIPCILVLVAFVLLMLLLFGLF